MYQVKFKNVGKKNLDFTAEFDEIPRHEEMKEQILLNYPGADVRAMNGRVSFCNGNKGSYVNYGTYTVTEGL